MLKTINSYNVYSKELNNAVMDFIERVHRGKVKALNKIYKEKLDKILLFSDLKNPVAYGVSLEVLDKYECEDRQLSLTGDCGKLTITLDAYDDDKTTYVRIRWQL